MIARSVSPRAGALLSSPGVPTGEAAWHAWRREGLGASDVAAVAHVPGAYGSPWSVWISKVGIAEVEDDAETPPHMRLGRDLEPVISAWFTRETGLIVAGEQTWCEHPPHPWRRCTVDGFVVDSTSSSVEDALGVFEAKYTADPPWDEVPAHYAAQVQWQLHVTGMERGWVAAMHLPFGRPAFRVYEVERDEEDIDLLVSRAVTFWEGHVLTGVPPAADGSEATAEALRAAYPREEPGTRAPLDDIAAALERRAELKARVKADTAELDGIDNTIRAVLGAAEIGTIAGEDVLTYRETVVPERLVPEHVQEERRYRTLRMKRRAA